MANGFLGGILGGISTGVEAGLKRGERQRERQIQQQQFAKQMDLQQKQLAQALKIAEQEFRLKREQVEYEQAEAQREAVDDVLRRLNKFIAKGKPIERIMSEFQNDIALLETRFGPGASKPVRDFIESFAASEEARKAKRKVRVERPITEEILPTRQSLVERGLSPEEATGAQVISGLQTILPMLGQVTGVGVPTARPDLPFVAGVRGARQAGQSAFAQSLSKIFGALGQPAPEQTPIPRQQ